MGVTGYVVVALICFVFFAVQSVNYKKNNLKRMIKEIKEEWGQRPEREYKYDEYNRIRYFYDNSPIKDSDFKVDDITWNDLSMDNIFKLINNTKSAAGEEYLYKLLRTINHDNDSLKEFGKLSEFLKDNPDIARELEVKFALMGRTKSISFYDFIHRLGDLDKRTNIKHYFSIALTFVAIGSFFINPSIAIFIAIAIVGYNMFSYYKEKGEVEVYFVCINYLVGLMNNSKDLRKYLKSDKCTDIFGEYAKSIDENCSKLSYLNRGVFLISGNSVNDSLADIVLEYIRMIFHVDLIKFNSIVRNTIDKIEYIDALYETMGRIEAAIAVASFKTMLQNEYNCLCEPVITNNEEMVEFKDMYHPLIKDAVKNSMNKENAVLLTGSNASGKSTFLKTVAINGIFAQTINLTTAKSFNVSRCNIYSSMALRDDLESNESYYIVEIKSLKRILDAVEKDNTRVMCFIDEVLRGTNTVERIAASSEILKEIAKKNTISFAATHDIELTKILSGEYNNYHFEEEVKNDDVLFNYLLKTGPATTRNAIKLLKIIGYSDDIIEGATNKALNFLDNGIWL